MVTAFYLMGGSSEDYNFTVEAFFSQYVSLWLFSLVLEGNMNMVLLAHETLNDIFSADR